MKTARELAHEYGINQVVGDQCGRVHMDECDDATAAIRAAQVDALMWASGLPQHTAVARYVIADKIAELEREGS